MPRGVGRVGVDAAGGTVVGIMAPTVIVNGKPIVCVGAAVAGHGLPPHSSPVMATGSVTVTAEGIPICGLGDAASCGHTLMPGSSDVFVD